MRSEFHAAIEKAARGIYAAELRRIADEVEGASEAARRRPGRPPGGGESRVGFIREALTRGQVSALSIRERFGWSNETTQTTFHRLVKRGEAVRVSPGVYRAK